MKEEDTDIVNSTLLFTLMNRKEDIANVSLLLIKDFKQTRFAWFNNNIHIYTEDSNKKVKRQYTRKIDQD